MNGYHNRPDVKPPFTPDGFYITGDVFRRDENGFHYFVGRTDDMFVSGGENIYPADVERMLERHPDVAQAAVVPIDDEIKGQKPVAFVIRKPGTTPSEDDIKQFALANAPAYQHPRFVWFVDELPLASTNKVDRDALHRMRRRDARSGALQGQRNLLLPSSPPPSRPAPSARPLPCMKARYLSGLESVIGSSPCSIRAFCHRGSFISLLRRPERSDRRSGAACRAGSEQAGEQLRPTMPGMPASTAVGISGAPLSRSGEVTARMRILPLRWSSSSWPVDVDGRHRDLAGDKIGDARAGAAVGHVGDIGSADDLLEQFAGELRHGAGAGRAVGQLVGIGLGVGDELLERLRRHGRMDHDSVRRDGEDRDRREILDRIVRHLRP